VALFLRYQIEQVVQSGGAGKEISSYGVIVYAQALQLGETVFREAWNLQ